MADKRCNGNTENHRTKDHRTENQTWPLAETDFHAVATTTIANRYCLTIAERYGGPLPEYVSMICSYISQRKLNQLKHEFIYTTAYLYYFWSF